MNKFEDVDVIASLEAIMKQAAFMVFPSVRDELLPGARRFSKRHKTA